jgi:hypothetical protein
LKTTRPHLADLVPEVLRDLLRVWDAVLERHVAADALALRLVREADDRRLRHLEEGAHGGGGGGGFNAGFG